MRWRSIGSTPRWRLSASARMSAFWRAAPKPWRRNSNRKARASRLFGRRQQFAERRLDLVLEAAFRVGCLAAAGDVAWRDAPHQQFAEAAARRRAHGRAADFAPDQAEDRLLPEFVDGPFQQ